MEKTNSDMIFLQLQDVVATGRGVQKRVRSDLVLRNEPECGITKHRQFSKRIIGGEKAQFAELPWQVGHHFIHFKYLESCLMLSLMVLLLTMLSGIVLSVIVLSVIVLSVIVLSVIVLSVIVLSVIVL
jgi:hypothetical protein